jgi:hypothetical protein
MPVNQCGARFFDNFDIVDSIVPCYPVYSELKAHLYENVR